MNKKLKNEFSLQRCPDDILHPWILIHREFLFNARLSLEAKGLLAFFIAQPEGWSYTLDELPTIVNEKKSVIELAIKQLTENGYLLRKNDSFSISETPVFSKESENE